MRLNVAWAAIDGIDFKQHTQFINSHKRRHSYIKM